MLNKIKYILLVLSVLLTGEQVRAGEVLILNASSGIGQALTSKLQDEGENLILTARNLENLKNIRSSKTQQAFVDFSDTEHGQLKKFLSSHKPKLKGIVVITPTSNMSRDLFPDPSEWEANLRASFISPLEAIKEALPYLQKDGKIVIVGGLVGVNVLDFRPHSSVIRLMWVAKAKELSRQLAKRGIHVNTISPGGTLTENFKKGIAQRAKQNHLTYAEQLSREVKDLPLGKYNDPSNVAAGISFLLSKNSDLITGVNMVIDGGFHRNY